MPCWTGCHQTWTRTSSGPAMQPCWCVPRSLRAAVRRPLGGFSVGARNGLPRSNRRWPSDFSARRSTRRGSVPET
ncbi:hypothetical protein ACFFX0_10415 [Citricoccus parietis]|uniref:Uncharacterized protein n=1 Tax=Citricoccus parietis TaxID=592307 RepID=A0ABV5FY31_9MICC